MEPFFFICDYLILGYSFTILCGCYHTPNHMHHISNIYIHVFFPIASQVICLLYILNLCSSRQSIWKKELVVMIFVVIDLGKSYQTLNLVTLEIRDIRNGKLNNQQSSVMLVTRFTLGKCWTFHKLQCICKREADLRCCIKYN